ncbi:uncharacterized protein LOC113558039, partial [Rhopalosiphum maidis]|uniref:uncharacterized protein LOC113558039 n=1 Tax=Rhopalosiphum maidis TaxID=43146 RepID=UPI000EFED413
MYFYNSLLLISNILTLTVYTKSQDPNGVGISACCFFGGRSNSCGLSDVQVTDTPATCTSICYDGVKVDSKYQISVPCMSLKTFLDEHQGIGGLILTGLEYDYDSVEFPGYSENL